MHKESTQLAYMPNGNLQTYLSSITPPLSRARQLQWWLQLARALSYVHARRVLVADVASRNVLIDADLSLKLCDFSEASLPPPETDMRAADDTGYTTRVDIGLLGAIMYEIVTGERCKVDLYKDNEPKDGRAYWPKREKLPATDGLGGLGGAIEGCWTGDFASAEELVTMLVALPHKEDNDATRRVLGRR